MSENTKRLTLERSLHGVTYLPKANESRYAMREIFGEDTARLGWLTRRLRITSTNEGIPEFDVKAIWLDGRDELMVDMGDVTKVAPAAGWSVLRMYCDKLGMLLPMLSATDPDLVSGKQYSMGLEERLKHELAEEFLLTGEMDLDKPRPFPDKDVLIWANHTAHETVVQSRNRNNGTLIDLLGNIQREYDMIRPDIDASLAVGGIVGARNLDVFRAAWDEAYWMQSSPTASAQALLASDVFMR